jgi:hypothetical protein
MPKKLRWPRRVKSACGARGETSPTLCGGRATAASTSVASISVPAFKHHPLRVELPIHLREQCRCEDTFGQRCTEAAKRRLAPGQLRLRPTCRQPGLSCRAEAAETAERQTVGQRLLEARIRKLAPLRQQQRASLQATPAGR